MNHIRLDWDSNFFGFPVAKIIDPNINEVNLKILLKKLKAQEYKLIYLAANLEKPFAEKYGGILADKKVLFSKNIQKNIYDGRSNYIVERYTGNIPTDDMVELSIQSARYSRFKVDSNFPIDSYRRLYKCWIENSLNGNGTNAVFVVSNPTKIIGLIALKICHDEGLIELLSVAKEFSGLGIGKALMCAAEQHFSSHNCKTSKVVTQQLNIDAFEFYTSCEYQIEYINFFYHFWI